jgi:hypothetical protein
MSAADIAVYNLDMLAAGRRVWMLLGVVLTLSLPAGELRADERGRLEMAVSRFKAADYDKALVLLEEILSKPSDPKDEKRAALLNEARPIYAAVLIWLEREADGDAIILSHLRTDPFYSPPPGEFHPKVVERFIKVRSDHRAELDEAKRAIQLERQRAIAEEQARKGNLAKRIAALERLASEERIVHRRSRWVAMAPFGIAQFQNGDHTLGVLFAVGQGLAVAASIASGVVAQDLSITRCDTPDPVTGQVVVCPELKQQFATARTANWVSGGMLAALVIGGIVQAQVVFEPDRTEIRKRILPKEITLLPLLDPGLRSAGAGVQIRF